MIEPSFTEEVNIRAVTLNYENQRDPFCAHKFGDHEWCEYGANRTVYDPSFGTVFKLADAANGTTARQLWREYLKTKVIDMDKFYIRKPSSLPATPWVRIGKNPDLTKSTLVSQGNNSGYYFFTYDDRSGVEARAAGGQRNVTRNADFVLEIELSAPQG